MVTKSQDVLIVGGGPAGLAAAIALCQRGASVTVADAMKPPIDKACGEGLMPDSLRELALLGLSLDSRYGAGFRGIRFVNHHIGSAKGKAIPEPATAHFPADSFNGGTGVGLKRQELHKRLVARAEEAGVTLRWHSTVQLRDDDQVLVAGEPAHYGLLVGADGHGSRVRRWAGLERGTILTRRFGFRQHYRVEPWSPFVEVHWGRTGQAYVTPVAENEVCVAVIARDPHFRMDAMLAEMPALRELLREQTGDSSILKPADRERGALTTTRRLRRAAVDHPQRGRIALVGDASGSADAITGEGMGMAFRQSLLLADSMATGDLERYNRIHPGILKLPQTMARVMLMMDRSEVFRNRALHMLASEPTLFARMLGVHLGSESLLRFVASRGLEVAWRLAMQSNPSQAPATLA
jgi:flavin-dependent dehydrogenase